MLVIAVHERATLQVDVTSRGDRTLGLDGRVRNPHKRAGLAARFKRGNADVRATL
jgi:hypothetical protein